LATLDKPTAHTLRRSFALCILMLSCACSDTSDVVNDTSSSSEQFLAEVWADNWFAWYVGDTLVQEDSVPITTERSFNAEVFSFDATYPIELNVILKDYKENDSGLEYIGASNQQMGDGGFIAQVRDQVSGAIVAATNSTWKCQVIHQAPLNKDCESSASPASECQSNITTEPSGWKSPGFDTTTWANATEYTEAAVSPKVGYDAITWDGATKLIWGSDLESDNTLLCKLTVNAP